MRAVTNKNISIIVAIADNNAIGKNNALLWHIPEDMKRFRQITTGHTVIMGRRTFHSLPKGALPDRRNIVISDMQNEFCPGCEMVASVEEALTLCNESEEAFIIGGGMTYRQFMPHARKLYITRVHQDFEADTFFPEINFDEWDETSREKFPPGNKNPFAFSFITYQRKQ